jgi:hypothetical protein
MHAKSPLPATWSVPQKFRDRLGEDIGRQRTMQADGHLLVILHAPPVADQVGREGRLFWRAPDGTWTSNSLGSGIRALGKHLEQYEEALQKLEQREERAELARDYFSILEHLAPLSRAAGNMYHTLQQAREAVPADRDLLVCRDRAYAIHRQAELLQTDTRNSLDCAVARRAEEDVANSKAMARASHRLNVLAAVFFPIVTLSSIFGMNLKHGFETTDSPALFWVVLAGGILGGLALKGLIIERPERTISETEQWKGPQR